MIDAGSCLCLCCCILIQSCLLCGVLFVHRLSRHTSFPFSFVFVVVVVVVVVVQDIDDIQNFGLVHQVDYIAASFVRKSEDIDTIRMVLGEEGANIKVRHQQTSRTERAEI